MCTRSTGQQISALLHSRNNGVAALVWSVDGGSMHPLLLSLLVDQDGVVSRRQALQAGLAGHDVTRLLRRRALVPIHAGIYVDHTGEPSWQQLAWAAVLLHWPAALTHGSAMRAAEGPGTNR